VLVRVRTDLSGDVSVLLSISVHVVSVDIVAADDAIKRLQHDARVVVRYHVRVPVLALVHVQTGRVPGKLLAGLDRLVLVRETHAVVRLELVHVIGEVASRDRRVTHHRYTAIYRKVLPEP